MADCTAGYAHGSVAKAQSGHCGPARGDALRVEIYRHRDYVTAGLLFSQAKALQKPWPTLRELAGRVIRLRIELSVLRGRIRAEGRVHGVI